MIILQEFFYKSMSNLCWIK